MRMTDSLYDKVLVYERGTLTYQLPPHLSYDTPIPMTPQQKVGYCLQSCRLVGATNTIGCII